MKKRIRTIDEWEAAQNVSLNESVEYQDPAYDFCKTVLKLGSKDNLFDAYMKKHKLNPEDLSVFMAAVITEINQRYL